MDIVQTGLTEITFSALFVGYFIYTLKQGEKREDKLYQLINNQNQVIQSAVDRLETIEHNQRAMMDDIHQIKSTI